MAGTIICLKVPWQWASWASRIFTKVFKPVFAMLRKIGHSNVAYFFDSLLQSDTYDHCRQNIKDTINLVDTVGLTVHPKNSVIIPKQCIEFVGFLLNSKKMTLKLAPRKVHNLIEFARDMLEAKNISIRDFAKLIGNDDGSRACGKIGSISL